MRIVLGLWVITVVGAVGHSHPTQEDGAPTGPLSAYLDRATLVKPLHYEGLWIFPLTVEGLPHFAPLTLDAAREREVLFFKELDQPQVNRVTVINKSDDHIFLMAGEVIKGAQQDRIIQESLLVPPHTTLVNGVFCVEPRRWSGGRGFESAKAIAAPSVRYAAKVPQNQGAVWDAVGEVRANLRGLTPGSAYAGSSLLEAQQSDAAQARIRKFAEYLARTPLPEGTRGVIVFHGTQPIAADLFASPELFAALWPKLRDSYFMSALAEKTPETAPTADDAQAFLKWARAATATRKETPGAGRLYELRGHVAGAALVYTYEPPVRRPHARPSVDLLVHAELFPVKGKVSAD